MDKDGMQRSNHSTTRTSGTQGADATRRGGSFGGLWRGIRMSVRGADFLVCALSVMLFVLIIIAIALSYTK